MEDVAASSFSSWKSQSLIWSGVQFSHPGNESAAQALNWRKARAYTSTV